MSRTLYAILLDLNEVKADWQLADSRDDGDWMTDADEKLDVLRAEFRETFKELTGFSWSNIETAQLNGAL